MHKKQLLIFSGILSLLLIAPYSAHATDSVTSKAKAYASDAKTYVADAAITSEIKARVLVEKSLDTLDIRVATTNGVVTLRGQVLTKSQSMTAEKIAKGVRGVNRVENNISVMPAP